MKSRLLVAILFAGTVELAHSQTEIPDRVTCAGCIVEMKLRTILDLERAPANVAGLPISVVQNTKGNYFVVYSGEVPLIFTAQGKFLQALGRSGAGPGEFRGASFVAALPGDSVLIVDGSLQRVSIFSPKLTFSRSVHLPLRAGRVAVLTWPDRVVMNTVVATPAFAGLPFHVMDFSRSAATHISSFGDRDGEMRPGESAVNVRQFFGVTSRGFWSMPFVKYSLAQYSSDGRSVNVIERNPDWFRGISPWTMGGPNFAPPPVINSAAVRGDTLWVAVRVPRSDWKRAWDRIAASGIREISRGRGPDPSQLYMTRLEIIDLKRRSVVARRDIRGIVEFLTGELGTVYDLDDEGYPRLRVFSFALARSN
jgi:hypothetical protein